MTVEITPTALAELVEPLVPTALIAFDVDGVLAPIVEHADRASLSPGIPDLLEMLTGHARVAIISGRAMSSLERLFEFAPHIEIVGSHGLERRGGRPVVLDDDEQYTFDQLEILGTKAVEAAGDGAWLEYKPASVAVHVREADRALAAPAVEAVTGLARMIDGAEVKPGHMVVELLARSANKGDALTALRDDGQPIVFFGDDVTDENAFVLMNGDDVSVRVGPGTTAAQYRITGTDAVVAFLTALT